MNKLKEIRFPEEGEKVDKLERYEVYLGTDVGEQRLIFKVEDECLVIYPDRQFTTLSTKYCEDNYSPLRKVPNRVRIIID